MPGAAISWLRQRLPQTWTVEPTTRADLPAGAVRAEAVIDIRGQSGVYTNMVVEARRSLGPRDVDRLFGSVGQLLRKLSPHTPILVVAPWLSPATRQRLEAEGISYIDLTGNALVRLDNPTLFIQTMGADRDPSPPPRGKAQVRGPKAGRLVRLLADVRPPYGVRDVAKSARLNPGYVSRLLDALDGEALVDRSNRGAVESVDVGGVLRRWAATYDLFKSNPTSTFIARAGLSPTMARLSDPELPGRVAVTGSFAAVRRAPVAAPALLCVYYDDLSGLVTALDLLPATSGANVALLRPFDPVVWERTEEADGITYAAPSQVAVDCLSGNGRMPAEGEALLDWMAKNEHEWRLPSLAVLSEAA